VFNHNYTYSTPTISTHGDGRSENGTGAQNLHTYNTDGIQILYAVEFKQYSAARPPARRSALAAAR
jgi:hypothetical protein